MPDPRSHQQRSSRTAGPVVVTLLLGVLGLAQLLSSMAPSVWTWGVDYWSGLPLAIRILLAGILVLAFMRPVAESVANAVDRISKQGWVTIGVLAICALLFIVFRSRAHVYGDGYSVPGYFAGGRLPEIAHQLRTQVLDLITHWAVLRAVVMPQGGTVEDSYLIVGIIAGLMSLWAIVRIARCLSSDLNSRHLILAAGVTSTVVTFWFGYMESYTLTSAAMLWALALALEAQRKPGRIWWAWGVWILAVAFHQLAVALSPAILWAHWRIRHTGEITHRRRVAIGAFVAGLVGWGIATSVYSLLTPDVFLPLSRTADSAYTAFGVVHLADMLNLLIFVAPLGLIGLVLSWRRNPPAAQFAASTGIVAIAATCMWYFSFWVDPLIGAFRDWDLLSGFGIPLSIWGGTVIARRFSKGETSRRLWVVVAAFAVIHAGGFVVTLRDPTAALLRVDGLVRQDMHYSKDFFNGTRLPAWAAVERQYFNRADLARDHLAKRVALAPTDGFAWANLGGTYESLRMLDSAALCYDQSVKLSPRNLRFTQGLGIVEFERNNMPGAKDAFERAMSLADTSYDTHFKLGAAYASLNETAKAQDILSTAIKLHPERFEAYFYMGVAHEGVADTAAAIRDYETALARGGAVEQVYTRLQQLYEWSGRVTDAIKIGHRWEQVFPQSANAPFLLGGAFLMRDQFDSAAAAFTRCLALSPNNALATYYLASSYRNQRQFDRAKELAERAAHLDTTLALPYLEMVYIAADMGDRSAARIAAQEYLRRSPNDSAMAYLRQFFAP